MSTGQPLEPISNELDIARLITTRYNIGTGDCFLGVKLISRDLKVSPDIDLLRVDVNKWRPQENTAIGFELKVLKARKYRGDHWRISLEPFFQGLGQVLTYFEHGVDRAALIVGFHKNCDQHPDEVKDAEELLKRHCALFKASIFASFPYLEIYSIKNENLETVLYSPNWNNERFPHQSDDAKLRHESIFKLQFAPKRSCKQELVAT